MLRIGHNYLHLINEITKAQVIQWHVELPTVRNAGARLGLITKSSFKINENVGESSCEPD